MNKYIKVLMVVIIASLGVGYHFASAEVTSGLGNFNNFTVQPAVLRMGVSEPYRVEAPAEVIRVASRSGGSINCGTAAICGTFNRRLSKCGCKIGPPRITRQKRGGKSCHNTGRAIDVMSIYCGGKKYMGVSSRYAKWVRCMAPTVKNSKRGVRSGGGMTVLFQQSHKRKQGVTKAHYDHAHFSIGCGGYI